ncbi:amidase [Deinococcus roseus]|uniref:Amidase n=1 Tax=Deinococcus roseus TaxID=392414 RepID=A0ABQ2DGA3_9DEIO|nr:amidase [Deinococcus roseus]GGJ56785.1 amidase [Deinococcus roseus]
MDMDHHAWAFKPAEPLQKSSTGLLKGLTFSVKDLIGVSPWPLKASTHAPLPHVPDNPVTQKLLLAGALLVGKTHLHEIALGIMGMNPVAGQALNPLSPNRISGGSSSGAAITVATRECDFALGTDTGGSIRIPAALCGVYGFKPTHNLYSTQGVLPLSPTCDHLGTFARSINMIQQVHQAILGERPLHVSWKGVKVGLWSIKNWVTPEVWETTENFSHKLQRLGASVEVFDFQVPAGTYSTIVLAEAAFIHRAALEREEAGFGEGTLALLQQGKTIPAVQYLAAMKERDMVLQDLKGLFHRYDVLIAPTVPSIAPLLGEDTLDLPEGKIPMRQAFLRITNPWSLLGIPVVSVPLPLRGLSIGVQVMLPQGEDARLLGLCAELG